MGSACGSWYDPGEAMVGLWWMPSLWKIAYFVDFSPRCFLLRTVLLRAVEMRRPFETELKRRGAMLHVLRNGNV